MKLVVIESPYRANEKYSTADHVNYARAALLHSIAAGEAPIASHLLYTQVLDDTVASERRLGIDCGIAWASEADFIAFYTDLGWSEGMLAAQAHYEHDMVPMVHRSIPRWRDLIPIIQAADEFSFLWNR